MFFEDQVAALANIRGHLRPDAKTAFVVWQPEDGIRWSPSQVLPQFMTPSDEPDTIDRASSLGDPDVARRTLEDAGFANVRGELRDVDASVDYSIPEGLTVAIVPDEHKQAARAALAELRAQFIDGDVARLHFPMVLITAEAP